MADKSLQRNYSRKDFMLKSEILNWRIETGSTFRRWGLIHCHAAFAFSVRCVAI